MLHNRLNALDVSLFDGVKTQTSRPDRRSLLALHAATADRLGEFSYLEIGSYMGGSLQALVTDERCRKIISIDPRPEWQPDDRPGVAGFDYPGNSTQAMLDALAAVPGADLAKIETIELSTDEIDPAGRERPDLCFIDGEHTYAAALHDARFCREVIRGHGVIAFHDFSIVAGAILHFLRESRGARGYLLRDQVWVVEIGVATFLSDRRIKAQLRRPANMWRPLNAVRAVPTLIEAHELRTRLRELRHRTPARRRAAKPRAPFEP